MTEIHNNLPAAFLERLQGIIPERFMPDALTAFSGRPPVCVRINTLKTTLAEIREILNRENIVYSTVPWYPEGLVLEQATVRDLDKPALVEQGYLYIQNLSSMLAVLSLAPQPGERVLDMCAAPGSKAAMIAALMRNEGELVCLEAVRGRYYKLKAVLERLGVANARPLCMDARRYRDEKLFDRILVDAPCSSEGRFRTDEKKSYAFWSLRKIKEMARKQKGLLLQASRLLKKGGVLVYSTCTFAPEENESVVDWLLRKTDGRLELLPVAIQGVRMYPALREWLGRGFAPSVSGCCRILPTERMEGFFIAKMVKKG